MPTFTSRPTAIEAIRYTGDANEIAQFMRLVERTGGFNARVWTACTEPDKISLTLPVNDTTLTFWCEKSKTMVPLPAGDWLIAEPDGTGYYPCAHDIFEARWRPADDDDDPGRA